MRSSLLLFPVAAVLAMAAGAQDPRDLAAAIRRGPEGMPGVIRRCLADLEALESFHPFAASDARRERLDAFASAWLEALDALDPETLDAGDSLDRHLLRLHLRRGVAERRRRQERLAALGNVLPFRAAILGLEEARRRLEPVDPRAAAAALDAVRREVAALTGRLRRADAADAPDDAIRVTPVDARRAAEVVEELRRALRTWFENHDGFEPAFGWWVRKPREALDAALEAHARALREDLAGLRGKDDDPLVGDPIGRAALEEALAFEHIAYAPEELLAIGERELAWCDAKMAEAAAEMGLPDARAALEAVKRRHEPPGGQAALVAAQAREAIAFLDARDLVTIEPLCRETWRVDMLSPDAQRTLPFAAYGGQKMLVAYPTDAMEHERKEMSLRGNNVHFSRIVTPHELIPGHHLQGYMAERHRPWRAAFRTPFLIEGWALHWEMLLWDLGWARGPEDQIGMLFWRRHRAARIVVSLRFHLGTLEPPAMVDYLVDRAGLERDGATAEVRRYVGDAYGPLYQCAYLLGGLQLRALHRHLVGRGALSDRAFHDAVLRENAIPIDLIRVRLLDLPLRDDHHATWRFADVAGG